MCEFCEAIIFDTPASQERHNKAEMHQKCVRVYEKAYDLGMDKLMKNMLKNRYDVERLYSKALDKDEARRREKKKRHEERSQVFVSLQVSDVNMSVENYELLDQLEGRAADVWEEDEEEEIEKEAALTEDSADRDNEVGDSEAALEKESVEALPDENAELDSLSRSAVGDQQERPSDDVLPDFENPENSTNLLAGFLSV